MEKSPVLSNRVLFKSNFFFIVIIRFVIQNFEIFHDLMSIFNLLTKLILSENKKQKKQKNKKTFQVFTL